MPTTNARKQRRIADELKSALIDLLLAAKTGSATHAQRTALSMRRRMSTRAQPTSVSPHAMTSPLSGDNTKTAPSDGVPYAPSCLTPLASARTR
jgi:hypothetical protein